jgi:tetratricopeptide (TPR) repeat protein
MTVRWKPLLVLSGLFLVIAVVGVIAMAYTLVPRGADDILPQARAERNAKEYEKALIQYKRALQQDGQNPDIYMEFASMYEEWAKVPTLTPEKRAELQYGRVEALVAAKKHGRTLKEPRRLLLADAMQRDSTSDSELWAKELVDLEPNNVDAHYVLALKGLEEPSPKVPDVKRHLAVLESRKAAPVRVAWVKARLAQQTSDQATLDQVVEKSRNLTLPASADAIDRMALLRLRALDVQATTDAAALPARVKALQDDARTLVNGPALAPARITRLRLLLEGVQKSLAQRAATEPKDRTGLNALVDSIDGDVDTLFKKALDPANRPELPVHLAYADHLRFRQKRDECLAAVATALRSPKAERASASETVLGLHAVAVEAALAKVDDKDRFKKAEPHLAKLVACAHPRYQGLGHLFQGAIDLERSGVGNTASRATKPASALTPAQTKLRASALGHLKIAATQLPDVAEAQARYGVALVLAMEQGLGRQYLQNALRLGNLDPQYQIWAAWSMVQAGYPEEAEPIVTQLLDQVKQGRQPPELATTLHMLSGEIHQARRSPAELGQALAEYEKSIGSGQTPPAAVQLRLAQIDVQLGKHDSALKRLAQLREAGQGGPAAEHLAVLTLQEQGKADEARRTLEQARKTFPDSDELVGLEAAMLAKAEKPREADRVLAEYLRRDPENIGITLMRAQVLADLLDDPKQARKLLVDAADHSENSGPLVQLALLDLKQRDYPAVSASIARIRARWKEAAIADLLDAQLSLDQNDISSAAAHFDAALKKDPGNKLVQFWKAQLDSRNGATKEAKETLEAIAEARPTKEVDSGQSLMSAAESALAGIALANGDVDGAIHRLEDLREQSRGVGGLSRADRWQLVNAYTSKGKWATAKREVAALLNDTKNPPSADERVRGANYYRLHGEVQPALDQLNYVIATSPGHPAAVVTRAYILSTLKRNDEATALLRKAIAASDTKNPPAVFYLMLAAIDSLTPPKEKAQQRAMATVDEGLKAQPDSAELVRAKYRLLQELKDDKAAVAFVESKTKPDSKGVFRRMLVEVYREHDNLEGAERVLRALLDENPKDAQVAANLVKIVALEAVDAARRGKPDEERARNEKSASLIRDFRTRFPNDLAFLQCECDLAARRGDLARAAAITLEMDKIAKNSPAGPLARARIYAAQGRNREAAEAYGQALERNPRQYDVRILLGQVRLKLGETDDALRQAKYVLDADPNQPDAVLLHAQAIAAQSGPDSVVATNRSQAIEFLTGAIKHNPKFADAYHLKSELQVALGDRAHGCDTLKACLEANPNDAAGLAQLIQRLSEPRGNGEAPSAAELADAEAIAVKATANDTRGSLMLANAVGYHKAGQFSRALPWARKAASKLDAPLVHLNYGDLLLSIAEATKDTNQAKAYFRQAVEQYDLVLKTQANSVEAINNKAWILHTYFGRSVEALDLASSLLQRVDPATLPGEFYDTLGAIQEATGRTRDAEDSYTKGLRRSPDHPVLNYHMAKLISADRRRAGKATPYLTKANAGRKRLSQAMVDDLDSMMQRLSIRGN